MSSAIVLPEGRIQEGHLKNLCALFDVVHIAMPWVMEPTAAMVEASRLALLQIHRPAESLRLEAELKSLLKCSASDFINSIGSVKNQNAHEIMRIKDLRVSNSCLRQKSFVRNSETTNTIHTLSAAFYLHAVIHHLFDLVVSEKWRHHPNQFPRPSR